jgi:hypothetical protein
MKPHTRKVADNRIFRELFPVKNFHKKRILKENIATFAIRKELL